MHFTRTLLRLAVPALGLALTTSAASGAMVYIDFGSAQGTADNFTGIPADVSNSTTVMNIIDSDGTPTNIDLTVSRVSGDASNGPRLEAGGHNDGVLSGDALAYGFDIAAQDSLYGRTIGGNVRPTITVTLSDLDPEQIYNFVGFAARGAINPPVDDRSGNYSFVGANSGSADLNASNNESDVFIVNGIVPDANNQIILTISPSASNNNPNGLFYINALRIEAVPEPGSLTLLGLGGLACFGRRRR